MPKLVTEKIRKIIKNHVSLKSKIIEIHWKNMCFLRFRRLHVRTVKVSKKDQKWNQNPFEIRWNINTKIMLEKREPKYEKSSKKWSKRIRWGPTWHPKSPKWVKMAGAHTRVGVFYAALLTSLVSDTAKVLQAFILNGFGKGFLEFPLRHCRFSAAPRSAGLIQFSGLIFWRCWGASCSKVLLVCCSTRSAGLNQCLFTQASGIYRCCQQKGIGKNWPAFGLV